MRKLFLILMAVIACTWSASAQTRTISGTVLDAGNHEPLIGATVMPVGGGQGTATDIDGNFTLTIPSNVKKANVSYVGYKSKEVELHNGMHIELESTSTNLDDVVVVAYGTANKESLTGSVAVVGAAEIEDRPVTSVTAALEGNAPGVQVNNTTGTPGSTPDIRVRGFNSINGKMTPLTVVDGAIYGGAISDLNPADIESMSVLKDAASCALYGAKGANGVILITTKKAKKVGKVDVTLQVSQGLYSLGLPLYNRMGANEWMQYSYNTIVNGALTNKEFATLEDARAYYSDGSYVTLFARNNIYGVANDELFDNNGVFFGGSIQPGYTDLDWWKAVSRTGHRQEYNLNASAAGENYNVFASAGYMKENGYMLKTDFERYSARINANYAPTSYLELGVNLAGSQQESNYDAAASGHDGSIEDPWGTLSYAPIYPYYAHDDAGNIIYDENGEPEWNHAGYLGGGNPPFFLRLNRSGYSSTLIDANIYGAVNIPYGFQVRVSANIHRDKTTSSEYSNNKYGSAQPLNGIYAYGVSDFRSHQFQQALTWTHEYGAHHVDALFNHENYQTGTDSESVQMANQLFPDVYSLSNFSSYRSSGGSIAMIRSERYLGRARYNYDQKYFGEVSLTREGTSRFSKDNRWGTFWSVGASWIISKENFMQSLTWLDYLKLRAAYGSVGNDGSAGSYAYWSLYSSGRTYGQSIPTMVASQIAANNVVWEATKTLDVALEGSLFNDRLSFTIGYFDKRNSDLLMYVTQPASAGSIGYGLGNMSILNNIGTMSNRGWELSFQGTVMRTKDINWTVSLDGTFLDNKIIKLPFGNDIRGGSGILAEGHSLYEFYTYKWAGVDMLTGQSVYEINPEAHEYWLKDENRFDEAAYNKDVEGARADGTLVEYNGKTYTTNTNWASEDFAGTALPVIYGSFGTNFSWKGLRIGALFTYSLGGKVYDSVYRSYMSAGTSASAYHVDLRNSWTAAPEGMTEDSANRFNLDAVPQLNSANNINNNAGSTRWLTSSDYLVLKNLNISYDLPQKWVKPLMMQNINLGVSVDNLFTITARKGMNPQQSWGGGQSTNFGTARVWSFQLTARF